MANVTTTVATLPEGHTLLGRFGSHIFLRCNRRVYLYAKDYAARGLFRLAVLHKTDRVRQDVCVSHEGDVLVSASGTAMTIVYRGVPGSSIECGAAKVLSTDGRRVLFAATSPKWGVSVYDIATRTVERYDNVESRTAVLWKDHIAWASGQEMHLMDLTTRAVITIVAADCYYVHSLYPLPEELAVAIRCKDGSTRITFCRLEGSEIKPVHRASVSPREVRTLFVGANRDVWAFDAKRNLWENIETGTTTTQKPCMHQHAPGHWTTMIVDGMNTIVLV